MNLVSGVYWASFRCETLPKFASLPHMQKIPSKMVIFIHFKTFLLYPNKHYPAIRTKQVLILSLYDNLGAIRFKRFEESTLPSLFVCRFVLVDKRSNKQSLWLGGILRTL
jgi:hypothetical protein